jgi:2-iminobutanoate/2-iminopropanoate deaminase
MHPVRRDFFSIFFTVLSSRPDVSSMRCRAQLDVPAPQRLTSLNIMLSKTIIKPAKSPTALGPYNHAVRVGDFLFCAGQIAINPQNGSLVIGDIQVQTDRVLQNVKAILDDQGLTFANVVKTTVFLTNLADFVPMNEVYAKYFTENFPARSTVQVAGLPKGAIVEIEVIAHF